MKISNNSNIQINKLSIIGFKSNNLSINNQPQQLNKLPILAYSKDLNPYFNEQKLIKDIEKITTKSILDFEKLKFLTTLNIKNKNNKLVKVYAFVTNDVDLNNKNEQVRFCLFDKEKDEIGYLNCVLNKNDIDSRETPNSYKEGMYNKGKGINPFVKHNQEYAYVSHVDNFFNSKKERTMSSRPHYSTNNFRTKPKVYKGVGKVLYGQLIKYIEKNNLENIKGITTHAKIHNGSLAFHEHIGFEKYDKIIYSIDSYTEEEVEYQGAYLPKEKFNILSSSINSTKELLN